MGEMTPGRAWPDERIDAAFATLRTTDAPPDLARRVTGALDRGKWRRADPWWRRPLRIGGVLATAAVLVLAVVAGSAWLRGAPGGGGSAFFAVRPGPDGLDVFDAHSFRFTYPAGWAAVDAEAAFSGGSALAVLGTMSIDASCGTPHVDINCVYQAPLDPGTVRVVVGTAGYRGGTVFDQPDATNGTTTRREVAGMPAILDDLQVAGSFYREDLDLAWQIGMPGSISNVVTIDILARDPGSADVRSAATALIDSFAFTPAPQPLASGSGPHLGHLAIALADQGFRKGYGQTTGDNQYSCQPSLPDATRTTTITFGPGGALGGEVPVTCSWTVTAAGTAYWRITLHVDWTVAGHSGRYTEDDWIDGAGSVAGTVAGGAVPPQVGTVPSPSG
jgi:hypothetical protein